MTTKQQALLKSPAVPYVALVAAMIIWGSSFVAIKITYRYYHPFFVIFARQLIATIVFIPLLRKHLKNIRKKDLKWLIMMAFFEPCLYYIFEAMALTRTSASQAGMITALLPVLVAVPSAILLKEKISLRTIAGFIMAIAGVIWLTMGGSATEDSPNPITGNFLEFMAMVMATGFTILLKKLSNRYSPFFLTAVQALIGTTFFLPIIFIIPGALEMNPNLHSWMILIYLGIIVTVGAYGFYNFGTSRIPASQSTAFVNLIPLVTLILSVIILKESLTIYQYMASTLVLIGVIFSQDRTKDEVPVY